MIAAPWHLLAIPRDRVTEFLGVFARFEYALKAAGFHQPNTTRAMPDWTAFASGVTAGFDRHLSPELEQAVDYLLNLPPQRQIVQAGSLAWEAVPVAASELETLLTYVRTVRNNLFHGGKFLPEPHDPDRDWRLVEASLLVLDAALPLHREVNNAFQV